MTFTTLFALLLFASKPNRGDAFIVGSVPLSSSSHTMKQQRTRAAAPLLASVEADPVTEVRRDMFIALTPEVQAGEEAPEMTVRQVLAGLAQSPSFMADVWQKRPFVYAEKDTPFGPLSAIKTAFSMEDLREVVTSDFVEAGGWCCCCSFCGNLRAITLKSQRNHSAISVESQHNRSTIAAQSLTNRMVIATRSQRNRSAIVFESHRNRV
jgi:hypothetical protein